MNGLSYVFDDRSDGFIRSEAGSVLFLQKAKNAKRNYATIVHSLVNGGGYNEKGNFFPSEKMQTELMRKFFEELDMDPSVIKYVEAHGTGIDFLKLIYSLLKISAFMMLFHTFLDGNHEF
jgi:fatty acid synthase